ncbi:unnamed protein product [Miscanthus lutarioriparius]|uniref:Uncharacterized protein n=1 Tax=Miscanthus lutarioriparius TaxID=422564 RepID=A0A811SBE1_9POAL|nr:unnamed protein product [Miscanthus lutarioriparius]
MAPPPPDRSPNPSLTEASPAPSATPNHHSGDSGKSLSPDAAPFFLHSAGRSKSMRWDDFSLSDDSDGSDDEQRPSYLDIARRGLSTSSPAVSPATAEGAPQATTRCGTNDITISAALDAIVAEAEIDGNDIILRHFFPENFIILCASQDVRDCVLAASPLPLGATSLVLRLAHAELSVLKFRVSLVIDLT